MTDAGNAEGFAEYYAASKLVYDKSILAKIDQSNATAPGQGAGAVQSWKDAVVELDKQAALEKAWMKAWYEQRYWAQINVELNTSSAGAKYKAMNDAYTTLNATPAQANVPPTAVQDMTGIVTTATSRLEKAQAALAILAAAVSSAEADVVDLGKRITRSKAEIAQLKLLATDAGDGTLDKAAALRLADYNANTNGEFADAASNLGDLVKELVE